MLIRDIRLPDGTFLSTSEKTSALSLAATPTARGFLQYVPEDDDGLFDYSGGYRRYIHLFVKSTLRLLVLTFEDLYKSTMANVFFRIANLNNNYPKVEYSQAGFLEDTDTILN